MPFNGPLKQVILTTSLVVKVAEMERIRKQRQEQHEENKRIITQNEIHLAVLEAKITAM